MPTTHRVQQGECMVSIAEHYGFFWQTIWMRPENADLREQRIDPTVLEAGDEVHIPDKTIRDYVRPTGARHTFRVKNVPARFILRLLDVGEDPRPGVEYEVLVDGEKHEGVTDGDGYIKVSVPPAAQTAIVSIPSTGEQYEFTLGALDPVSTVHGAKERLANLNIPVGDLDDEVTEAFVEALKNFQRAHELEPTGELDLSTQAKLRHVHGA